MMKFRSNWVQHIANPLHVYCRLIDFGMGEGLSKRMSMFYEKYLYQYLAKDLKESWNFSKKRSL